MQRCLPPWSPPSSRFYVFEMLLTIMEAPFVLIKSLCLSANAFAVVPAGGGSGAAGGRGVGDCAESNARG